MQEISNKYQIKFTSKNKYYQAFIDPNIDPERGMYIETQGYALASKEAKQGSLRRSAGEGIPVIDSNTDGFDIFYGIPYSNDMRPEGQWDYAREAFPPLPFLDNMDTLGTSLDQSQFIEMFTKRSIDFIEQNKDSPFFIYLAHSAPHTPLIIGENWRGQSDRGAYGDVVEELDNSVGEILNTLKRLQIHKKTFVIFTSDNGPWGWANINGGSAGLLKGNKGSVYEGGYRVPAIAWMPGSIESGIISRSIASTLDILPTVMSMAGSRNYDLSIGITTGFNKAMCDIILENTKKQGFIPDACVGGDEVTNNMGFRPSPFMLYENILIIFNN